MTVAILGAGLACCGDALELAGRGQQVVLFDRRSRPMQDASRWCEGKVHLGLVYANDASIRTAPRFSLDVAERIFPARKLFVTASI